MSDPREVLAKLEDTSDITERLIQAAFSVLQHDDGGHEPEHLYAVSVLQEKFSEILGRYKSAAAKALRAAIAENAAIREEVAESMILVSRTTAAIAAELVAARKTIKMALGDYDGCGDLLQPTLDALRALAPTAQEGEKERVVLDIPSFLRKGDD